MQPMAISVKLSFGKILVKIKMVFFRPIRMEFENTMCGNPSLGFDFKTVNG